MSSSQVQPLWRIGVQLALLAYMLSTRAQNHDDAALVERNAIRSALLGCLQRNKLTPNGREWLHLPLPALRLICNPATIANLDFALEPYVNGWQGALRNLTSPRRDPGLSNIPWALAGETIAHQILYTNATPAALFNASAALFAGNWKAVRPEDRNAILVAFSEVLGILRSTGFSSFGSPLDTHKRLSCIKALADAIDSRLHFALIENVLYHHTLAWPIVTLQGYGANTAISIPVAVDVYLDGRAKCDVSNDDAVAPTLNVADWQGTLERALLAAKMLWHSKNGSCQRSFRDKIASASAVIDFGLASQILSEIGVGLDLTDDSMGAYFSQVFLQKFLGRSPGFSAAVTGGIGSQVHRNGEVLLDFEYISPGSIMQKARYVCGAFFFDKFVLPDKCLDDTELTENLVGLISEEDASGDIQINFDHQLSNVADSVQTEGWRQFTYIRAPDVAFAIHRRPEELPNTADARVRSALHWLKSGDDAVLQLSEDADLSGLFSALRYINFEGRLRERGLPVLSWLVVRAINDERDQRFWYLLWKRIGGSEDSFIKFRCAPTVEVAARLLAEALNTFSPSESFPSHRAPDLIVLLGAQRAFDAMNEVPSHSARHALRVEAVLDELNSRRLLAPSPNPTAEHYVGRLRLIYTHSGMSDITLLGITEQRLPDHLRRVKGVLRTFRFGFTQQMVSLLLKELNFSGLQTRSILDDLCAAGHVGKIGGNYYIRDNISMNADPIADDHHSASEKARRHFAAGLAMAPYLSEKQIVGLTFRQALIPENVHEASFHLAAAANYALETESEELRRHVRMAQHKLTLFFEARSWYSLYRLARVRSDLPVRAIFEAGLDLVNDHERTRASPQVGDLMLVVRAGMNWLREVTKGQPRSDAATRVATDVRRIFDLAETLYQDSTGEEALIVETHKGMFLEAQGDARAAESTKHAILACLKAGTRSPAVHARWFEYYGDKEIDNDKARFFYSLGIEMVPNYVGNWPRYFGVGGVLSNELRGVFNEERAIEILAWSRSQQKYWQMNERRVGEYLLERCMEGLARLEKMQIDRF